MKNYVQQTVYDIVSTDAFSYSTQLLGSNEVHLTRSPADPELDFI